MASAPASPQEQPDNSEPDNADLPDGIDFEPASLRRRHDGWSSDRQIGFLKAIADGATVEAAARRVSMTRDAAYKLARRPCGESFRRGWDAAVDCNMPDVERAAIERSRNGVARPIFYKGTQVGEWRHHDERLTMFLLRSRRPERYGKWIERMPSSELDEEDHVEDAVWRLDDAIGELELVGPNEGNPVFDDHDGEAPAVTDEDDDDSTAAA